MDTYTVKQGDTLNSIANQYGYKNYKEAGLKAKSGNPDLIRPGETFGISQSATSPARDAYVATTANGTTPAPTPTPATTTTTPTPVTNPFSSYNEYLRKASEAGLDTPEITAARDANNAAIK